MKQKNVETLNTMLQGLEAFQMILDKVVQEEQEAFDNLSESYQNSEKGEERQEHTDLLQEASDNITQAISNCYSAIE